MRRSVIAAVVAVILLLGLVPAANAASLVGTWLRSDQVVNLQIKKAKHHKYIGKNLNVLRKASDPHCIFSAGSNLLSVKKKPHKRRSFRGTYRGFRAGPLCLAVKFPSSVKLAADNKSFTLTITAANGKFKDTYNRVVPTP